METQFSSEHFMIHHELDLIYTQLQIWSEKKEAVISDLSYKFVWEAEKMGIDSYWWIQNKKQIKITTDGERSRLV